MPSLFFYHGTKQTRHSLGNITKATVVPNFCSRRTCLCVWLPSIQKWRQNRRFRLCNRCWCSCLKQTRHSNYFTCLRRMAAAGTLAAYSGDPSVQSEAEHLLCWQSFLSCRLPFLQAKYFKTHYYSFHMFLTLSALRPFRSYMTQLRLARQHNRNKAASDDPSYKPALLFMFRQIRTNFCFPLFHVVIINWL